MKTRPLGRRFDLPICKEAVDEFGRQPRAEEEPYLLLTSADMVSMRLVNELQQIGAQFEKDERSAQDIALLMPAVLTLSAHGNWRFYRPDMAAEADFPPINRRDLSASLDALGKRLEFLRDLSAMDVRDVRAACQSVSKVSETERKNSSAPSGSSTEGTDGA